LLPSARVDGCVVYVYFNPHVDIIYFGEGACMSTIIYFLKMRQNTPRIAIDIRLQNRQLAECRCVQDEEGHFYGRRDPWGEIQGIQDNICLFQFLHGINIFGITCFPGCPFLEEIFWVIKTGSTEDVEIRAQQIDPSIVLCDVRDDVVPQQERGFKDISESQIQRVQAEIMLPAMGKNNWLHENNTMPTFRFSKPTRRGAWGNPIPTGQRPLGTNWDREWVFANSSYGPRPLPAGAQWLDTDETELVPEELMFDESTLGLMEYDEDEWDGNFGTAADHGWGGRPEQGEAGPSNWYSGGPGAADQW
jgi:hypothetical protein